MRSILEERFKEHIPEADYETYRLPYVSYYIPDFDIGNNLYETKGLLDQRDSRKLRSVNQFLTTDTVMIIVGSNVAKEQVDQLRSLTSHYNVTLFQYPKLVLHTVPCLPKSEFCNFKISGIPKTKLKDFPLTGIDIVKWSKYNSIQSLPVYYTVKDKCDFSEVRKNVCGM